MGTPRSMTNPKLKTQLWEYGKRRRTDGVYADNLEVDALVVSPTTGSHPNLDARQDCSIQLTSGPCAGWRWLWWYLLLLVAS